MATENPKGNNTKTQTPVAKQSPAKDRSRSTNPDKQNAARTPVGPAKTGKEQPAPTPKAEGKHSDSSGKSSGSSGPASSKASSNQPGNADQKRNTSGFSGGHAPGGGQRRRGNRSGRNAARAAGAAHGGAQGHNAARGGQPGNAAMSPVLPRSNHPSGGNQRSNNRPSGTGSQRPSASEDSPVVARGSSPARPGRTRSTSGPSGGLRDDREQRGNGVDRPPPQPAKGQSAPATPSGPAKAAPAPAQPVARTEPATPPVTELIIPAQITVRELAEKMHRSPIEIIKTLMNYGQMVPITQSIDFDTAAIVGEELGITVKPEPLPEPEVKEESKEAPRTLRQLVMADEDPNQLVIRPPVVTVLGHVDHGKTTLLDAIRETRVVDGEAGGITQHIGAYQVERQGRKITFLDTPGHAAFTAMRARGAMVTDIAVLVVAADDGVMPQTQEAIAHARAAQVPIVVALNKIDKPTAGPERVKQELADNGLLIEEYGGDVICVPVSAKFRRGIDELLENILLVADIDPLKANPNGDCIGTVIESRLDKTRGPTATLLIQNGTLRIGDSVVLGDTCGKIRAMFDDKGRPLTEALPSTPVVVLGLADVPAAGDLFRVVADERTARTIVAERQSQKRAESGQPAPKSLALEDIFAQVESGQAKELNLILKADVQGSIEPIVNSLEKLSNEKVRVKILHQATGSITESDVMLAIASKAIILGFSATVDSTAQRMAEAEGVDIRVYEIIYNLIEDVEKALKGMLEPVYKEVVTGHAEVRAVFRITKVGNIAGCYVTDGEITRNALGRIRRAGNVVAEERIASLKRFQEDANEVKAGFECGISLHNFSTYEIGDVIESYKKERVS